VNELTAKVAWVTGAGSGIGRAIALRLAASGAAVILTGRRREPLEETVGAVLGAGGLAFAAPADVAEPGAAEEIVRMISERHRRLDIYVGAAGYNIPQRRWSNLSPVDADGVLRANLHGAFHASAAALSLMRPVRDGLLVHISSWSGKHVAPFSGPAYTAAKHGVVAMSESINLEVAGEGIRSTVISPGGVDTPLLDNLPEPPTPASRARLLKPEDCADLVHFIATLPTRIRIDDVVITPTSSNP
jgi:NAD(P)-dependent dehydrogenase (short-subunit alcohol dehydrogenase family)